MVSLTLGQGGRDIPQSRCAAPAKRQWATRISLAAQADAPLLSSGLTTRKPRFLFSEGKYLILADAANVMLFLTPCTYE